MSLATGGPHVLAASFWILDPIYTAMGTVLAWFFSLVPSYGLAIALLTISVRVLLIPLTTKQVKSQQAMQRIQPELKRLQAKYKDDRQKLNEEMMKFYKENKVNPVAGCLPLLLQTPLFLVLYRLILGLTHQPEPKHLPRSSSMFRSLAESGGRMVSWGFDLAKSASSVHGLGKAWPYYLLVVVTVATGFYQQRQMTARMPANAVNPQMKMIGRVFPAMIGLISLNIPAGVVVYFIISNLWQIGQQAVTFRAFGPIAGAAPASKEESNPGKGGANAQRKGGVATDDDRPMGLFGALGRARDAAAKQQPPSKSGAGGKKGTQPPSGKQSGRAKQSGGAKQPGGRNQSGAGKQSGAPKPGAAKPASSPKSQAGKQQTGRQQPKSKRPPPSPRPKGLPPPGQHNGHGTAADNTPPRKDG